MIERIKKALNYIIDRNTDYEPIEENDYITGEYLGSENHSYYITINNTLYDIDAFTTVENAKTILDYINNGYKIEYIYDTTGGFDTVVGDIDEFVNNIRDDVVAEYEYDKAVNYFSGVFTYEMITKYVKELKKE